jgi:hypothetical protein
MTPHFTQATQLVNAGCRQHLRCTVHPLATCRKEERVAVDSVAAVWEQSNATVKAVLRRRRRLWDLVCSVPVDSGT